VFGVIFRWIAVALVTMLSSTVLADEINVESGVYSKTIKRWTVALSHAEFSSTSWLFPTPTEESVDKKHRNGHRDTVLVVSETAIPDDITIVVWFHGLGGFSDKTFRQRIMPQLNVAAASDDSFVIVIPEMPWSTNTSTPRGRQKQIWKSPASLKIFTTIIRERLDRWAIETHGKKLETVRWVFVGHSAGGSAITSASREGSLCELKPELVVWSDASYGSWFEAAWDGCLGSSVIDQHVLVRKWDKPYAQIREMFKRRFNKEIPFNIYLEVLDRRFWTHGKIGDNVLELARVFIIGC
jgi:hypothetical protein